MGASTSASAPAPGRPSPWARREYDAHGLPYHDAADAVAGLAEACTVIRRLWTEDEPFDFDGAFVHLAGAWANPKPVQRPHPPIMIVGVATPTLRVVAEHADLWNYPGSEAGIKDAAHRMALIDRFCGELGRDPASITRSTIMRVSYDHPGEAVAAIGQMTGLGFGHIVLALPSPYPAGVARWVADKIIAPSN